MFSECSLISFLSLPLTTAGIFRFSCSAPLFALSLETEFYYGRKCSRVDQISVLVNFVPVPARSFFQNRTHCALQGKTGRQPCGRKVRIVSGCTLWGHSMWVGGFVFSCLGFPWTALAGIFCVGFFTWKWLRHAMANASFQSVSMCQQAPTVLDNFAYAQRIKLSEDVHPLGMLLLIILKSRQHLHVTFKFEGQSAV